MKKITQALLLVLAVNSVSLLAQTAQIAPSLDTYIESNTPANSFAADTILKVKHSVSQSAERTAWLKFPTTHFPTFNTQVILKLVKTKGEDANVSLYGADGNLSANATWNTPPDSTEDFYYGGYRAADTFYFDVTEYVQQEASSASGFVGFKIFTHSDINASITFASDEAADSNLRPRLIFYATKAYDIPLFSMHSTISIPTENGNYTGELLGKKQPRVENRDLYGGLKGAKSTATGFFRVEQDCDDTWHIIDPDGNLFYSAGLNSVEPGGGLSVPQNLKNMGLNTMGSWSDETIANFAYTPRFNVLVNFKNSDSDIKATYDEDVLPVFEPNFKNFCDSLALTELPPYLNDKWVLGYFLDNELVFHKDQLSISLTLSSTNAQYIEADTWMKANYGNNYSASAVTAADEATYQGHVADTYFKIVSGAFRAVDTNHMLIGTRFHAGVKYIPEIFSAAGDYMDIISVNYYSRFEPEEDAMEMWMSSGKRPFIITEFYTMGDDAGLSNEDGAGWSVPTQQDRADWFENWMLKLLRNKGNVGFHWFRYTDKIGNDANKGLYSSNFVLYQKLADSFEKTCTSIYTLRSQVLFGNYNYNDLIDCDSVLCGTNKPCSVLSISDDEATDYVKGAIYPNPANHAITIINSTDATYEILNIMGQHMLSGRIETNHQEVAINHLAAGIYLVRIANDHGKTNTFKIIKE